MLIPICYRQPGLRRGNHRQTTCVLRTVRMKFSVTEEIQPQPSAQVTRAHPTGMQVSLSRGVFVIDERSSANLSW